MFPISAFTVCPMPTRFIDNGTIFATIKESIIRGYFSENCEDAVFIHGEKVMQKPGIKTITANKLIAFLLIASLIMLALIGFSFRSLSQTIVEKKALALSEVVMAGLTTHMKAQSMSEGDAFLNEIRGLDEIKQITIIRSLALQGQYGPGRSVAPVKDDVTQQVFETGKPSFVMADFTISPHIRAVIPYVATNKGAVNCLNCHDTSEGTVLGVVDMELNLSEYRNLSLKAMAWIALFSVGFIALLILNIFQTLQKFVKAPLDALIHNTKYTFTQHKPVKLAQFKSREFDHVAREINQFNSEILSNHLLLEEKNETLMLLNDEIETTLQETVFTMGLIEERRSKETKNHTKRVAEYSRLLASKLSMPEKEVDLIATAAPLHDIGKMSISDTILLKTKDLTPEETAIMQSHPEVGFMMLKHSRRDILKIAAIIAYQHHERWDGSGYPNGLKGNEIHPYARIVALADVFDALFSKRTYKDAWPIESVGDFIKQERGKMFEPRLVDIFIAQLDDFVKTYETYNELQGDMGINVV